MNRKRLVDFLVYLAVRILICVAQSVRIETGRAIARRLAWLFCDVLKIRADVIDDNLVHAFPDLSARARKRLQLQMWEHLFLLVLEVAHTPRKIHETNWRDYVELENEEHLVRLLFDKSAAIDRYRPPGKFRGGRIRAGHSRLSDLHGRTHAR